MAWWQRLRQIWLYTTLRHRRDAFLPEHTERTRRPPRRRATATRRAGGIVAATIEVYNSISAELLPTPAKFHYTFNLRDISKVFQGMLMISPVKCKVLTQREK